jgi:DNA-directed RNA polymerase specialized sigma24 family protein
MNPAKKHRFADEALLVLLDRHHAARQQLDLAPHNPAARSAFAAAEQGLGDFIYRFIQEHLRPSFRRSFPASSTDTAVRFTEMLNNLFVEVLEKKPDAIWRARSTQAIARHVSIALKNDIRDALRSLKRRERLVATGLPTGPEDSDTEYIEPIALSRQAYFEQRHGISLADALEAMDSWTERGSPWTEREEALRLRHIDGLTYETIAAQMQLGVPRVKELIAEGLHALRQELLA